MTFKEMLLYHNGDHPKANREWMKQERGKLTASLTATQVKPVRKPPYSVLPYVEPPPVPLYHVGGREGKKPRLDEYEGAGQLNDSDAYLDGK